MTPQKIFNLEGQKGCKVAANILYGFDCSRSRAIAAIKILNILKKLIQIILIAILLETCKHQDICKNLADVAMVGIILMKQFNRTTLYAIGGTMMVMGNFLVLMELEFDINMLL